MVDVNLTTDDLTVLGGPASVSVDLDIGATGQRGSVIFAGNGKPTEVQESAFLPSGYSLQAFDLYINQNALDDEYLSMYQYRNTGFTTEWVKFINLSPNVKVTNEVRSFTDGAVDIEFSPYEAFPSYSNISASDLNVQCTIYNQNPVAVSVYLSDLVVSGDLQVIPISIKAFEAIEDGAGAISWQPLTGQKRVQLHITMI